MNFKSLENKETPYCNFGVARELVLDTVTSRYPGLYLRARRSRVFQDRKLINVRLYIRSYVPVLLKAKNNEF